MSFNLENNAMQKYLIFFTLFFSFNVNLAIEAVHPGIPFLVSDAETKPLDELADPVLQKKLEDRLKKNKYWASLLLRKKMAVGLVDISDSSHIKFARINGDDMMYAASLPKIAILLAAYQSFADHSLTPTAQITDDLRLMISKSDNAAATRMIDLLGFKKIQSVLTDQRYMLYDENCGGGLWVGKRYAKIGLRYPDPMRGLSHAATVTQICRFYYLLVMGKLVSFEFSKEMLDMLADPELHHKFVNTLDRIAPSAKLYRKSGTWKNYHSDSVLVWGPEWRRYIATAMVEDIRGERILRELIIAIEDVLKDHS
jgi:beta-lactamase class A